MNVSMNVNMNLKKMHSIFVFFKKLVMRQNLKIQFSFCIFIKHINGKYKGNKH